MKSSIVATFVLAHTVCAQQRRMLLPQAQDDISPRAFGDGICTLGSTCDGCFGEGYIICDKIGCFNPDEYQQCCKNAVLCVASTDDCCDDWGGTGVVGTTGAPVAPTALPTATETGDSWECTRDEDPEDCCQKGSDDLHYCGGEFLNSRCFNVKNQWCCTDGTVCDEKDCCENLFTLSTTKPWLAEETGEATSTAASSGSDDAATTTESSAESTTSDDAGSPIMADGGLVKVGLSIVGVVLLL